MQYTIRHSIGIAMTVPQIPHILTHMHTPKHAHTDIRELVQVDDVMEDEDLKLGPNGGLIFCME